MNWHDYFTYNAETGELVWKERPLASFPNERNGRVWNKRFAGKVAGGKHNMGYLHVAVNGEKTLVHRVVLEMHKGPLGSGECVDHIDMIRTNNRIENLRKCSNSQNMMNSGKRPSNVSGFKGVARHKDRWVAQIRYSGRNNYLGRFKTPQEAHDAYCVAAKEHHGEFARTE